LTGDPDRLFFGAVTTEGTSITPLAVAKPIRAEKFLELVAPKLALVEEHLRKSFRSSDVKTIRDVGAHILGGGGKRLRPVLLLISSQMVGYRGDKDVVFATVVELIHTATLVHDDIIDEAPVRRGRTSINYLWGNQLTVLIGDLLYTYAMNMAVAEGNLEVLRLLLRATVKMTEGEIIGLEQNGRADLTLDQYFDILGRKTAALFGASCSIPAHLNNDVPEVLGQSLYDYGYNLGMCFQIIDDLLDFTSSTEILGKPALSDLKEGKLTLPLLLALPHATAPERRIIESVALEHSFGKTKPPEVVAIVNKYDALDRTREFAREYSDRARAALEPFPSSPAREALDFALDFVLSRDR
jgi:octaprenyl-diphosphate synthase